MKRAALLTLLLCAGAGTPAQVEPPRSIDRSNEGVTQRYIAETEAENARRAGTLRERGLLEELEGFRNYLRTRIVPVEGQPGIGDDTRRRLNQVRAEQFAINLTELGKTVRQVDGLEKRGIPVVRLAQDTMPSASLLPTAVRAEDVVVGEVVAFDGSAPMKDGRLSSITFRSVETIAGPMRPGDQVVVRLRSGCGPPGRHCSYVSTEPNAFRKSERYLLFLSGAAYAQEAALRGFEPPQRPRYALNLNELIRVEGERLHPTHGFAGGTLAGAKAELAAYAKAEAEVRALLAVTGAGADAAWYALDQGVSLAEAKRRLALQHGNRAGDLQQLLSEREKATFAGLWIEHETDYRVVVAFTREPEATLRKYTSDTLFVARLAKTPLAAMDARRVHELLRRADVPAMTGTSVQENVVTADLLIDRAEAERRLAAKGVRLPEWVQLVPPTPLPFSAPPVPENGAVKIFPKSSVRTGIETAELNIGRLVLDRGCIRLRRGSEPPAVAFFGAESALAYGAAGESMIMNLWSGEKAALGQRMVLGGGAGRPITDDPLLPRIAELCGPGPVVWVGNPTSYAMFRERALGNRARELAHAKRISFADAVRQVRAEWAEEDRRMDAQEAPKARR